jgi:hypothetical protein
MRITLTASAAPPLGRYTGPVAALLPSCTDKAYRQGIFSICNSKDIFGSLQPRLSTFDCWSLRKGLVVKGHDVAAGHWAKIDSSPESQPGMVATGGFKIEWQIASGPFPPDI